MPDDYDYAQLEKLLSSPERWTQKEAALVEALLANQRNAVASLHPRDVKRRHAMQEVVEQMETALLEYRRSQ